MRIAPLMKSRFVPDGRPYMDAPDQNAKAQHKRRVPPGWSANRKSLLTQSVDPGLARPWLGMGGEKQPRIFRLRPPRHATDEDLSAGTPDFGGLRSRWRWLCILALARVADSPILGFMLETRLATLVDAVLINAHRRAMFAEVGLGTPEELETMSRHFTP